MRSRTRFIVPMKRSNKAVMALECRVWAVAEGVEGRERGRREGKRQRMLRTQRRAQHVTDAASLRIEETDHHCLALRSRPTFDRSPVRTPKVQRSKKPHAGICAGGGR